MPLADSSAHPGHFVNGRSLSPPWPDGHACILLGMGCFWGAERLFWQLPGVYVTAVGYAGGEHQNPSYELVCSGTTGHAEVVLVVYNAKTTQLDDLLKVFWQEHDPTQGMRQGNDVGSQYRSAIYCRDENQLQLVRESLQRYQQALTASGYGAITTEVRNLQDFHYAEDYHQQYLAKNPGGYCGLAGTGVVASVAQ